MKDKSVPERTANEETKIYSKDYINVVIQIPLKYISIALSVLSGLHLCFIEFRLYFPADTVAKWNRTDKMVTKFGIFFYSW